MPSSTASCRSSSVRRSRNTWRPAGIARGRAPASSRCVSPWPARPGTRTRSSCRGRRFAPARWRSGSRSPWGRACSPDGRRISAGGGPAAAPRSRKRVALSSFSSILLTLAALQGPGTRLTYRIRVIEPAAVAPRVLARGALSGGFFTRRRVGRSRRGLPLWEEDTYRRVVRLAWSDTARVYPFGNTARALWVELQLEREFAGGEARAAEAFDLVDSTRDFRLEAVARPRRARVILNLVRGDTVSAPRPIDLIPEEPPRIVQLVLKGRATTLVVSLTRPDPARSARDRALALDADVVCLRVSPPAATEPLGTICGRLNNVARQLPLPTGDTLAATFAWPGPR